MHERYAQEYITQLWSNQSKLRGWDEVELAVIHARANLGQIPQSTYEEIARVLREHEPDIAWWKAKDKELQHDLNAFVEERRRHLRPEIAYLYHKDITSYDTEESAFAHTLQLSSQNIAQLGAALSAELYKLALKHRTTVLLARTHGQGAKLKSFGARILSWRAELDVACEQLESARVLHYSKLSGAVGNYGGGISPDLEREALRLLNFKPFLGATQIMPRVMYAQLAQSLASLCSVLGKIALDFRLGSRSGKPLWHEPFGKKQMGSSAMPHKKNTINTERMEGMRNMAVKYAAGIVDTIPTWEERDIGQSCVERVFWPDLFHTAAHMLLTMHRVLRDMVVYPDHMLQEIRETRGTYASDEAKNFLAEELSKRRIPPEVAYRIIQFASFNALEPSQVWAETRARPLSMDEVDFAITNLDDPPAEDRYTICEIVLRGHLRASPELEMDNLDVDSCNRLLREVFHDRDTESRWRELFMPSRLLLQEDHLFRNARS